MKKIKNNKGITLIALIITIILLLILAVVTISAVNEGNLFAHANNAATRYQKESELENTKIAEWLTKMEQYDGGTTPANPQGGGDNPDPVVDPELSALVGKYYFCNAKGCWRGFELKDGMIAEMYEGEKIYTGSYVPDTENKSITLTLNLDGEDITIPITYNTVINDSEEIENVLINMNGGIYIKNPGTISNIAGIYVNQEDSNKQYKFQIETNDDGVQYIHRYYSSDGGSFFSPDEACYCLYNETEACYYLYYSQDNGNPSFKFDGNNTITKLGSPDQVYLRQS